MIRSPNDHAGRVTGWDLAAGQDHNGKALYIPHAYHPGCGYTILLELQIRLHRLGIYPVRCKSCRELLTDCEGS